MIWLLFLSLTISFSFAQAKLYWGWGTVEGVSSQPSFDINILLGNIVDLLNIIWLPFAILAGNLLTNKMIFWAGLGEQLFAMWTSMKVFAFFVLGGIFLFMIFSYFFRSQGEALKKYLPKIILAALGIPLSWFFLVLLLDLSSIMMVAVWAFGSSFVKNQQTVETFSIPKSISLMDSQELGTVKINWSQDSQSVSMDSLLKDVNSLAGPLVTLGASILQFPKINSNVQKADGVSLNVELILKLVIIGMFVIPLILLIVVALMRIFYIWVYLIFAPFLVLDWVFNGPLSKKPYFQLSNVIGLIFQPVWVIAGMSLGLLFVRWMASVITSTWTTVSERWKAILDTIGLQGSQMVFSTAQWTQGSVEWGMELFDQTVSFVGGIFGYLILWGITVALLWALIKIAFATTQITKWVVDWSFNFIEWMAKAAPVVPWIGWQTTSIGALGEITKDRRIFRFWPGSAIKEDSSRILEEAKRLFWVSHVGLLPSDENIIMRSIVGSDPNVQLSNYFKVLNQTIKKRAKENGVMEDDKTSLFMVTYDDPVVRNTLMEVLKRPRIRDFIKTKADELLGNKRLIEEVEKANTDSDFEALIPKIVEDDKFQAFFAKALSNPEIFLKPDEMNKTLQSLVKRPLRQDNLTDYVIGEKK